VKQALSKLIYLFAVFSFFLLTACSQEPIMLKITSVETKKNFCLVNITLTNNSKYKLNKLLGSFEWENFKKQSGGMNVGFVYVQANGGQKTYSNGYKGHCQSEELRPMSTEKPRLIIRGCSIDGLPEGDCMNLVGLEGL